jgi:hypothetical protein
MSVSLTKENSGSTEAYFLWEINNINFLKGMLYLTDIAQQGNSNSAILKYQLHSSESPVGSHIFEGLGAGEYYAELTIIDKNNVMYTSELPNFFVYEVKAPVIDTVSPKDSSFTITLRGYENSLLNGQSIDKVNFILFGRQKKIIEGELSFSGGTSDKLNIVMPYSSNNIYNLTNYGIKNGWYYEIACFYTDNNNVSGEISNTKVSTPTNTPNQITNVSAHYDYSNKKLIINYTNPDDVDEWIAKTVRATITYGLAQSQIFYFNETSLNFSLLGQQIVFNESVVSANTMLPLPADTLFKLTLCMESTIYGYGDEESEYIECMVPTRFCSEPSAISDPEYTVGDKTFAATFTKSNLTQYNVTVKMTLTNDYNSTTVINNYTSGAIVDVDNGRKYTSNLQIFYTTKTGPSITFGPCTEDVIHFDYDFIPHGKADAPSNLLVTYGDGSFTLTWDEPASFNGYILDAYELSYNNFTTSILTGSNRSFSSTEYNSGVKYPFKIRAATKSYDLDFYSGTELTKGNQSPIDVYPLKKPVKPILDTQTPGDTVSSITFHDDSLYNGVVKQYNYTVGNEAGIISSGETSKTFTGLTNNYRSDISLTVVTTSGAGTSTVNTQESEPLNFSTTPFKMSDVPVLSAVPYEDNVVLSWQNNNPTQILGYDVKYDVEYKLSSASNWNTSYVDKSSPLTIPQLTPNSVYDFRIRSKVYNLENAEIKYSKYSDDSEVLSSRPFKYTNAPTMDITAGNETITIKLTPPVTPNDNYYAAQTYYAEAVLISDSSKITTTNSTASTLTFNLSNLSDYVITGWYDTLNTETNTPYLSNKVSNEVAPFDPSNVPELYCTPDNGKIKLSWDDGNMYGLDKTYQVSSNSDGNWSVWSDIAPVESSGSQKNNYSIEFKQTNGESKSYKIQAVILNAGKTYYSVSNVVTVTPFTKASAPVLVSYVSSDKKITLKWSAPAELGGLPLLRYEVKKDSDAWTPVCKALSYDFATDLVNGQNYAFSVQVVTDNSVNQDNLSYVNEIFGSSQLIQYARPYAEPTISLDAVVSLDSKLKLNWTQDLGGHIFDHYKIYYNGSNDDDITTSDLNYTIEPLINGTNYNCEVEVYVKDENDNAATLLVSKKSNAKTNIPYKPADSPKNLTSDPFDTNVTVEWKSGELNGLPLLRYEVKKNTDVNWTSVGVNVSKNFPFLLNGTEYEFKVRAVTTNSYYMSDPNSATAEVTGAEASIKNIPYLPLEAPLIIDCVAKDKSATLSWNQPTLLGLDLDHYEVSGGVLPAPVSVGTLLTYTFTGLTNNTEYPFYVKAVANHVYKGTITSDNSEEVRKIPFKLPDPVTGLVCSAVNKVLTITFNNPSTSSVNNGLAQDYKYRLNNNQDYETIVSGGTVDITAYGSSTITVNVYARIHDPNNPNNDTNSVYSLVNSINVVNSNLASDIQNLTAKSGDTQLTLNWENLGSGSTFYVVRITDSGSSELAETTTATTATITGLENGKLYTYNVYASQDDMLQIKAKPIGPPIINSVINNGNTFNTDINLNGDTNLYISIIAINSSNNIEIIGPALYTNKLNTIVGNSSSYIAYTIIAVNSVGAKKYPIT